MRGYMFRNRWGALFFVAMTMVGVVSLVGGEEDHGVLLDAAEDLGRQRAAMEREMSDLAPAPPAAPTAEVVEFASDEDLIDEATGFDPTPPEQAPAITDDIVPADEVVIVSRDGGTTGP